MATLMQVARVGRLVLQCLPVVFATITLSGCCCCGLPTAPKRIGGMGPGGVVANATSNYEELDKWCLRSSDEIGVAEQANPIRGKEKADSDLEQLRGALLGKQVRWQFPITFIEGWNGQMKVGIRGHIPHMVEITDRFGNVRRDLDPVDRSALLLLFPRTPGVNGLPERLGADDGVGRCAFLMTPEKARNFSVGQRVTMTGVVTEISGRYTVKIADPKLE